MQTSSDEVSISKLVTKNIGIILSIVFGAGVWLSSVKFLWNKIEKLETDAAKTNTEGSQYAREASLKNAQEIGFLVIKLKEIDIKQSKIDTIQADVQQIKGWVEDIKKKNEK